MNIQVTTGKNSIPLKEAMPTKHNEILKAIAKQPLFFNDLTSEHWFFDFKIDNLWISSIKINNANNVNGIGDYLTVRLGTIHKNVSIRADYGSIKIDKMAADKTGATGNHGFMHGALLVKK